MAIARETTTSNIKPLTGAIVRRYTASAAIDPAEWVYISGSGTIAPADGSAVATSGVIGVALPPPNNGTAFASGDRVDVVVFGPCQCVTGATAGAIVYVSDTTGEPTETTGTKTTICGIAETATIVFVNPQVVSLS